MKKLRKVKEIAKASAIALASAVLVASVAAACTSIAHGSSDRPAFTITNTISSSAVSQTPVLLYPGVQDYLWYTAHNPLKVPITVRSLSISTVNAPTGCPTSNLNFASTTFSGSLVVPAHGSNSTPVPISLIETHRNQDPCEHTTFGFTFKGSATFSVIASTRTYVASSHNPSAIGQSVTYTATVISGDGSGNQPGLGSPTGSVNFLDGTSTICSDVALTSGPNHTSVATCTPTTYEVPGVHPITAVYTNTDGNFAGSTSQVLEQVVQPSRKTLTILASWPDPSVFGFPVVLTASVFGTPPVPSGPSPSGTLSFFSGTPFTAHSLLGTETLGGTGKATLTTSTLPIGTDNLFAVYSGDSIFAPSTSLVIIQAVLAKPGHCDDPYDHWFYGSPGQSEIQGSSGNNFFWLPSGTYQVSGSDGNNCFWGGDGNSRYSGGNGHNHIICGNGNNAIFVGNGQDDVQVGDGRNQITLGNGNDTVAVGNGSGNQVILGNGNDTLAFGNGSSNKATLGSGVDTISLGGSHNSVTGTGRDTVYLGGGTGNTFTGSPGQSSVCHLPTPPSSWHGSPTSYFHDTLTNCAVVSP